MKFQDKVKKHLEKKGFTVVSIIRLSQNGYPDLLAMKNGRALFVECKEKTDTLKNLQKIRIENLIMNGFLACCIKSQKGIIYGSNITEFDDFI